jgi:hypothetical protein
MVNITVKKIVFFVSIIFLINLISAGATIGNASNGLVNSYGPGDAIVGWINISLSNEPSNSILTNSLGQQVSLLKLIGKSANSGFTYTCNPVSCESDYIASNKENSKMLNLPMDGSALIAFNLTGNIGEIASLQFNVLSNNPETQKFPLSIDILNDGQDEWSSYFRTDTFGSTNYGCLKDLDLTEESYLNNNPYCQRIALTRAPRVRIGAEVDSIAGIDYTMSIESADGSSSFETCTATTASDDKQMISCIPDFTVNTAGSYYICINTKDSADANKYTINYKTSENPCGFAYPFSGSYTYNFKIFAEQGVYAPNINITLNDAELENAGSMVNNVESYIKEYISNKYGNNCTRGCVIPIKIYAGVAQDVLINNFNLIYQSSGLSISATSLYNVGETPAKLSSSFQNLIIDDSAFTVPEDVGKYNLTFYLNNTKIISKEITIGKVPSVNYITPNIVPAGYATTFKAGTSMGANITRYTWDFGDGTVVTSNISQMEHTYTTIGNYLLKMTISDSSGRTYLKIFTIFVESAQDAIPDLLTVAEMKISLIKQQVALLSSVEKTSLNRIVNVEVIENNLTRMRNALLSNTTSEAEYESMLKELVALRIPDGIGASVIAKGMVYYPKADYADLDSISNKYGETYELTKQQLYKDAIVDWELQNTNVAFDYSQISSIYSDYEEESVKNFDIIIDNTGTDEAYAVIRDVGGIVFGAGTSSTAEGGYYYFKADPGRTEITFSTTGDVDFSTLPMIISPALSKLTLSEDVSPEKTVNKWAKFILIVIVIIVLAAIAWVLLKMWYKKRYENYLFKNKNNLYNILNYIKNSKAKGMSEKDIMVQLRKSGWNSEQVTYALKKYAGKETGMPEIQIGFKLKKNTDVNSGSKNTPK